MLTRIPICVLLASSISISCQEVKSEAVKEIQVEVKSDSIPAEPTAEISFLFMGDFMMHDTQIDAARDSIGNYEFDHYFDYTHSLINGVDFAIANLEVTLAGPPFRGYPQFCAPDEYALAIQRAGIDVLTTANNHSNDRGSKGLIRTINFLDSINMPHLGTYIDTTAKNTMYPLVIEKDGIRVAVINYTYGTNGLVTRPPNVVNMFNELEILADLEKAKSLQVDKIIAIAHWGGEYKSFPDTFQKTWGEWLLDNGADVVIGGHPHWVQPIEYRTDSVGEKMIVWSLGNIISNQRREHTDGGSSLQFTLFRDSLGVVQFKNVGFHLHWVYVDTANDQRTYHILPITKAEALQLEMDSASSVELEVFIKNERTLYLDNNLNVPEFQYNRELDSYYLD
jgi:poly-gamma-glutamate capsule biosynthesis protein CapA/YwtB (metallophosphatase superfamily)